MAEELLINVKIGGDNTSKLTSDIDKLETEITDTAKAFNTLAESEKATAAASRTVLETNQKMKTAFEVVGNTLQLASTDVKMFQQNLLSLKFPTIGDTTDKEMKILYKAFVQAQQVGETSFDMLSLATKVFKGDINQVTLAVAQYNELFEKNPGVDAVTLNTSAFITLRNSVMATGGSISNLNKEIGQMVVQTSNFEQSINTSIIHLEKFVKFDTDLQLFTKDTQELGKALIEMRGNLQAAATFASDAAKEFLQNGENINANAKAVLAFDSSISGLNQRLNSLVNEYKVLGKTERDGKFGQDLLTNIEVLKKEAMASEISLNKLGIAASKSKSSGFDPLSNSVMQIAREMPNMAISSQIFFMSISNNLPMLGDAVSNFRAMQKSIMDANAVVGATQQAVPSMMSSISKGIFSIGGAFTLVSGLLMVFGPQIMKWFSELSSATSKEYKIKLSVDEDAIKKLTSTTEKIRLFAVDYNKAIRIGDEERIKGLEKVAAKEYSLNKDKLKAIGDNVNAWRTAFAEYLKIAKDTYYNEALSKKKSEVEVNRELALAKMESAKAEIRATGSPYAETEIELIMKGQATRIFGAGARLQSAIGEFNKLNEEVKTLNKVAFRDVYSTKTEDLNFGKKDSAGKKFNPAKVYDDPEIKTAEIIAKEVIKWEDWKVENMSNLSQAQIEISQDRIKNSPKIGDNVFTQLAYDSKLAKAELLDVKDAIDKSTTAMKNAEQKKLDFAVADTEYSILVTKGNKLEQDKADKLNEVAKAADSVKRLEDIYNASTGSKSAAINLKKLNDAKAIQKAKEVELKSIESSIKLNNDEIEAIKKKLNTLKEGTKEYEEAQKALEALYVKSNSLAEKSKDLEAQTWREKVNMVQDYVSAVKASFAGMDSIMQGSMDLTNQRYDAEKWQIEENIDANQNREELLYQLELRRYDALKKNFEQQKIYKEAQAWMDFASGSIGIWTAPGITSLAPFGYILAGIQQAALLATTVGNVATIRAQTLEKPHKPGSAGASSSANGANIALNPTKTALTSKEENLNMMNQSGKKNDRLSVKVTDINNIQTKVSVRETNSAY